MEKYICIHGHFYQPPRENPWLEAVELQDSASPYHDWNERITAECYAPNAHARLLDGAGKIRRIVNNYSKMSFNFGPTLLSWMKEKSPDVLAAIVKADEESRKQFSGHGTALAQCYNHIIMPLANHRDKVTQVIWGIADFEARFGRKPEGMWLPETAADDKSLEVLAEHGIKFTILSPFQASKIRLIDSGNWLDVNGGQVDPSMPYLVKLPSGKSIAVFFYDGNVAKAVAFERLLTNGETFANRIMGAFDEGRGRDQLVNVATDGESYGHHFTYGDMALAFALRSIEEQGKAHLTTYGEYLEKHPPTHEAQIHQGSAWSCSHGVGRWCRDCGCNSGGHAGWNQKWREPLRNALDWLRDKLVVVYETKALAYLKDPWAARDAYISVILDRSTESVDRFFGQYATRSLSEEEQIIVLRLLEMQRHALLMYTSCGWFFDELSGLETVQIIQYAARAIQIAAQCGENLEPGFLDLLAKAESNLPDPHDGRQIYDRYVRPAVVSREFVSAHYAISSLFENYPEEARIYSFTVKQLDRQSFTVGKTRLVLGRIQISFEITRSHETVTYAAFHTGDHNINCAIREYRGENGYASLVEEAKAPFERGDFPEVIRVMDRHFGSTHYSLTHLFRDEQRKVLHQILSHPREEVYGTLHHITEFYAPLRRFMADLQVPPLNELVMASEIVLNSELNHLLDKDALDMDRIRAVLAECAAGKVKLSTDNLSYVFKATTDRISARFAQDCHNLEALQQFINAAEVTHLVPFKVNLWKSQNTYYEIMVGTLPEMRRCAAKGNEDSKRWIEKFLVLGDKLGFVPASGA